MPEDLQATAVEADDASSGPPSGPWQRGGSSSSGLPSSPQQKGASSPLLPLDALLERELNLMHASACARYSLPGQQPLQGASGGVAAGTARGVVSPSEYGVQEESQR